MTNGLPLYGGRATDVIDAMLPESSRDALQLAEQRRVSTDPKWLRPTDCGCPNRLPVCAGNDVCPIAPELRTQPRMLPMMDGRTRRATTTRRDLLKACRELMSGGVFRPSMEEVCELARRSVRSGFQHFPGLAALHLAALDKPTRDRILEQVIGADWEIALAWADGENVADHLVRAIVRGKV